MKAEVQYLQTKILEDGNASPRWIAEDNVLEADCSSHLVWLLSTFTAAVDAGHPLNGPEYLFCCTSCRGECLQIWGCAGRSEASQQDTQEDSEESAWIANTDAIQKWTDVHQGKIMTERVMLRRFDLELVADNPGDKQCHQAGTAGTPPVISK